MINSGENINCNFLLKEATVKTTTAGSPYLDCVLANNEQAIPAVLWSCDPAQAALVGGFVHVTGQSSTYRDKLQIKINTLEKTDVPDEEASELIPSAPINAHAEYQSVLDFVASIEDPDYKQVAERVIEKYGKTLKDIPAAKSVHQAGLHGLLMHVSYMLKAAAALAEIHSDIVDRSLLLTGVLCHDIGKLSEFTLSPCGLVAEYSVEGNLLGHPYIGMVMVAQLCEECGTPYEKSLYLKHLVGAHSGKGEWGAVKAPAIPEAELLHLIDLTDAHLDIYREAYKTMNVGEGTRSFTLDHFIFKRE